MKVTIITLYDGDDANHLVAVVEGEVSDKELKKMAKDFDAYVEGQEGFDEDDARQMFKVEVNTQPSAKFVKSLQALY